MRIETLDQLHAKLAARRRAQPIRSYEHLLDVLDFGAGAWDEKKHPRGQPKNKGEFVRKGQQSAGSDAPAAKPAAAQDQAPAPADPSSASTQPSGTTSASTPPQQEPPASNRGPTLKPDDPDLPAAPAGEHDLERFFSEVEQTPAMQRANKLMQALQDQLAPGTPITHWSKVKNSDGGEYTPERKAMHQQIVNSFLNPKAAAKPGEKPVVAILLGAGGSGKTSGGKPLLQKLGKEFTGINADDVKAKLPEYEGWNAGAVHEESSDVAEGDLLNAALEQNHNILFDLTGKNQEKMVKLSDRFQEAGYDVHIVHVSCPGHVSCSRAWDRFAKNAFGEKQPDQEPGRLVPPKEAYAGWQKPIATYNTLKAHPAVKSWTQVDTNVQYGEPVRILDRGEKP